MTHASLSPYASPDLTPGAEAPIAGGPPISPLAAAKDACRATQIALGADWACCVLINPRTGGVTHVVTRGRPAPEPQEIAAEIPRLVEAGPHDRRFPGASGEVWAQENTSLSEGRVGSWLRRRAIGARLVGELVDPAPDGTGRLGHLFACYRAPQSIDGERVETLRALLGVCSLAIASANSHAETLRVSEENAEQASEQGALRRVATAVARDADPRTIFNLVAEEAAQLLGGGSGRVARFDGRFSVMAGGWGPGTPPVGQRFPLRGARAVTKVFRTGLPARVDDYDTLTGNEIWIRELVAERFRSGVAAPIWVGDALWGALVVLGLRDQPAFPASAERRLQRFAELIALAISGAQARQSLEEQARSDPLTGLPNRRAFEQRLSDEATRAERYGRDLSVVLIDIDHFKTLNDTYGHSTGDDALRELAERLTSLTRRNEIIARIGGEEFAWLLPECDSIGAMRAAERARRIVERKALTNNAAITISAGVSSLADTTGPQELISCADRALYWAKAQGRNVVIAYSTDATGTPSEATPDEVSTRMRARASILALARTVDAKDRSTLLHSQRVADLACRLARECGWSAPDLILLREAGLLHDVGKIGVPDEILAKQGRLSGHEYGIVRTHAALGAQIAAEVLNEQQVSWVRGHHERWDGRGYPDGLNGSEIPEGASLLALADAWDTMTNERPYQSASEYHRAVAECEREAGRQFSPKAVAALLALAADDRLEAPELGRWLGTDRGAA